MTCPYYFRWSVWSELSVISASLRQSAGIPTDDQLPTQPLRHADTFSTHNYNIKQHSSANASSTLTLQLGRILNCNRLLRRLDHHSATGSPPQYSSGAVYTREYIETRPSTVVIAVLNEQRRPKNSSSSAGVARRGPKGRCSLAECNAGSCWQTLYNNCRRRRMDYRTHQTTKSTMCICHEVPLRPSSQRCQFCNKSYFF